MRRPTLALVLIVVSSVLGAWGCSESSTGNDSACGTGQTLCSGACVSLADSAAHCGACEQACATGQSCAAGACSCLSGLTECGASCANLQADGANCGRCGNACGTALVCSLGHCADSCAAGLAQCGSSCADLATDVAHCGSCDVVCAPGMACTGGACACAGQQTLCGGACTNTLTDPSNCGSCGKGCSGGACVSGQCSANTGNGGSGGNGAGGNGAGGNGAGGGTTTDTPAKVCDEPALLPIPATTRIVGSGTAASCTDAALRQAVTAGGFVSFDCGDVPATIAVTSEILAGSTTVIDGGGKITLDGGGTHRILVTNSTLSVRNLRFVNGKAADTMEAAGIGGAVAGNWRSHVEVYGSTFEGNAAARGGGAVAVWTGSTLTIVASRFSGNRSWYGGAVYSLLSPLTIVNSEFVDNESFKGGDGTEGEGGAIGTDGASESPSDALGGTIQICGSVIRSNLGHASGGGAYIWAYPPDVVTIDRSTIDSNTLAASTSGGSLGGGMRISNAEIKVVASSFVSNHAESHGGGLYLDCAPTCTIDDSTFFDNRAAPATGTAAGYGGAIFGAGFSLNNVTLAHNFASGHGGALFGGNDWVIDNTLFVDNAAGNPWNQAYSCGATGTGSNVLQWLSASRDGGSDRCVPNVIVADPRLAAAPADNGGPTPTLLLAAGSPALQIGNGCEATDQRGQPRNPNACDLGSVEMP